MFGASPARTAAIRDATDLAIHLSADIGTAVCDYRDHGFAQSNRRPLPVPDAEVTEPARDTRSADVRKLEIAAAAKARTLPALTAGMAQVCRVQSWQFALIPQLNNAVRMDVSPTLGRSEHECLRSVVYASRAIISASAND